MTWSAKEFRKAIDNAGIEKVKWWGGWDRVWHGMSRWRGNSGRPSGLILHHTAGASTTSKDPSHPGNRCGADDGQARFVNRHPSFNSPASQFTLRRCGQLDVNAYLPCYHAGKGDFAGTQWAGHKVPRDSANSYFMGIEIVSKGIKDDLTDAQWETLTKLVTALAGLAGWKDTGTFYVPRHRDWAPNRKPDIRASNAKVQKQFKKYGAGAPGKFWDGKTPDIEGVYAAEADPELRNPAAWRLACRLADLGFFKGTPKPKGEQGYPVKAMIAYNAKHAPNMEDGSKYGPKAHARIFG